MRSKLKWYYVLLAFAVVGVLATAILRILTPPPIPVPTTTFTSSSVGNTTTQFRNLTYTGTSIKFPSSLPVGLVEPSTDTPSSLIDSLVTRYQLSQHPNLDFIWLGQAKSLTYDKNSNVAILSLVEITPLQNSQPSSPFPTQETIAK